MRTRKLGRWLLGGALAAAGVAAVHGGSTGTPAHEATAFSWESVDAGTASARQETESTSSEASATDDSQVPALTDESWEWG